MPDETPLNSGSAAGGVSPETSTQTESEATPEAQPQAEQSSEQTGGKSQLPEGVPEDLFGGMDFQAPSQPAAKDQTPQNKFQYDQKLNRVYRNEQERALFSNMSNEAYNALYKLYQQHADGQLVPSDKLKDLERQYAEAQKQRFYDHPEGYTLSDGYRAAQKETQYADAILAHYAQQLDAIEQKQPVQMVKEDGKGGYTIDEHQYAPSAKSAAVITSEMARWNTKKEQAAARLETEKTQFSGQFGGLKKSLDEVSQRIFGRFENNPQFKMAVQKELESFPASVRNLPEWQWIAKASVLFLAYQNQNSANRQAAKPNATQPNNSFAGANGKTDQSEALQKLDDIMHGRIR